MVEVSNEVIKTKPQYAEWLTAIGGVVTVHPDTIQCGGWTIDVSINEIPYSTRFRDAYGVPHIWYRVIPEGVTVDEWDLTHGVRSVEKIYGELVAHDPGYNYTYGGEITFSSLNEGVENVVITSTCSTLLNFPSLPDGKYTVLGKRRNLKTRNGKTYDSILSISGIGIGRRLRTKTKWELRALLYDFGIFY